jgi:hypothetical protein
VHDSDFLAVGCGLNDCLCIASDFVVLVLVLNEVVLVLDAVFSSTSTANAEYEYEKPGETSIGTPKHANRDFLAVGCGLNDCLCIASGWEPSIVS